MSKLEQYENKYETVKFERSNGILQVTFHSHGGSLKWGGPAHGEFGYAFADIGSAPENRVVIITGTGVLADPPKPGTSHTGKVSGHWSTCWRSRCPSLEPLTVRR